MVLKVFTGVLVPLGTWTGPLLVQHNGVKAEKYLG